MIGRLAVVGVSHHTAPIEVRERFTFRPAEIRGALERLRREGGPREAVLLSTCNRTELYLHPVEDPRELDGAEGLLAAKARLSGPEASEYFYRHRGSAATRHLFRVAAGLDSMVLGEAEIQGQVRDAYELALESAGAAGALTGAVLNRLFQMALSVGGRVRAETPLGEGAASVASVAVELAGKIFGALEGRRVLVLGAGDTSALVVEALAREGVRGAFVANRTYDRAERLARRLEGRAIYMEELGSALRDVDILVASTAAPHPILTRERMRETFPDGPPHPLLMVDIAIPRDVEPEVHEVPNVFLYNLDDLMRIVDSNLVRRQRALPAAEAMVAEQTEVFERWYVSLDVVPAIRRLRDHGEEVRRREMDRLLRGLDLSPEERERVEAFSRRLLNKLLHGPTTRLREGAEGELGPALVEAVRFLYSPTPQSEEPTIGGDHADSE